MSTITSNSKSTRGIKQLSSSSPLVAVFLRTLAWECYVAERDMTMGQVVTDQVRVARLELGLPALGERDKSGAGDAFVQRLRKQKLITAKGTTPKPVDPLWEKEWRVKHLPSHAQVRHLSYEPVRRKYSPATSTLPYTFFSIALRDPAMPMLDVWVGPGISVQKAAAKRRGAYVLKLPNNLYLGQSDEFETRLRQHSKTRQPDWCVFCSPVDETTFTLDALGAAESLLISFWNEICHIDNRNRGGDRPPPASFLQQAILFTASFSATLIWLVRDYPNLTLGSLTFKTFRDKNKAWPNCYLKSGR